MGKKIAVFIKINTFLKVFIGKKVVYLYKLKHYK